MHLGIVSDTHDDIDNAAEAADVFQREGVDAIVHCGDVVAPFTAAEFDVGIEFHAVRGNNDGEWALADTVNDFGTYHGELAELAFDGREIAVSHGTREATVDALVGCGNYDYVFHGHTHEYAHEEHDGTVRINPGGLPFEEAPDPPRAVVLDVPSGDVDSYELGV